MAGFELKFGFDKTVNRVATDVRKGYVKRLTGVVLPDPPEAAVVASSELENGANCGARLPLVPTKFGGNRNGPAPFAAELVSVNSHKRRAS